MVLHGDARELELAGPFDAVVTSPPYPGLIDYHEQHRYAYELLGLDDRREREIGAAAAGTCKAALAAYVEGIVDVFANVPRVAEAARAGHDRRQRPPRPLPGDPRSRRPPARAPPAPTRQPSHRPPRRRVLRRRPRRARAERRRSRHSNRHRHVSHRAAPSVTECSHAPSPMRSSGSIHAGSRSRRTSSSASPASRSSGSPTAPARKRSNASAAASARRSSTGRPRRITVNLAPAALRKEGSGFDLPIALAILAASHQLPAELARRRTPPSASSRSTAGCGRSPACSRRPRARGARASSGSSAPAESAPRLRSPASSRFRSSTSPRRSPTFAASQSAAARAADGERRAAAGASRPRRRTRPRASAPGARDRRRGRSQPAARRPARHRQDDAGASAARASCRCSTHDEALEVTRIHSVAGLLAPGGRSSRVPPFRAPHHTRVDGRRSSAAAGPRPGEASLAHRGVLLLDELPEFMRPALEALRQPLEDGVVSVSRGPRAARCSRRASSWSATMNLCPCGARGDPGARVLLLATEACPAPRQALPGARSTASTSS